MSHHWQPIARVGIPAVTPLRNTGTTRLQVVLIGRDPTGTWSRIFRVHLDDTGRRDLLIEFSSPNRFQLSGTIPDDKLEHTIAAIDVATHAANAELEQQILPGLIHRAADDRRHSQRVAEMSRRAGALARPDHSLDPPRLIPGPNRVSRQHSGNDAAAPSDGA
ncbi:hypothetical protein ACFWPH_34450 [Nocardia sp. NPDC058499]|uniref:hypothetical protein n=1 Tax=Nocardia sp. NPDC058499 TaxID=3346530 RepID=UPI00364CEBF0